MDCSPIIWVLESRPYYPRPKAKVMLSWCTNWYPPTTTIRYWYDLCTKILSLLTVCFNPTPFGLGPGFGDTPGDPGCRKLHSTGRGVLAASPPGILCLSALGVPYAGGELAPRGTCTTLALYLVKRNNPS